MSALIMADSLLRDAEEELRVLLEEDAETGEFLKAEAEWVDATVKTIQAARRLLEKARREQARVPARLVPVTSPLRGTN